MKPVITGLHLKDMHFSFCGPGWSAFLFSGWVTCCCGILVWVIRLGDWGAANHLGLDQSTLRSMCGRPPSKLCLTAKAEALSNVGLVSPPSEYCGDMDMPYDFHKPSKGPFCLPEHPFSHKPQSWPLQEVTWVSLSFLLSQLIRCMVLAVSSFNWSLDLFLYMYG